MFLDEKVLPGEEAFEAVLTRSGAGGETVPEKGGGMKMCSGLKKISPVIVFSLCFCVSTVAAQAAEKVSFSFNPEDGITFFQILTTTRERDTGGAGRQVDEAVSKTKITMNRTDTGWDVVTEPVSTVMKRDGREIENPFVDVLSKLTVTYKLDPEGHILDIEGYEAVVDALKSQFPPPLGQQFAKTMNSGILKEKATSEWNSSVGDFVGKTVQIGDIWSAAVPYTLPDGSVLEYNVMTKFQALEPCAQTQCVRIEQVSANEDADLSFVNETLKDAAEAARQTGEQNVPEIRAKDSTMEGRSVRLIDPKTMLIYHEEVERTTTIMVDFPQVGVVPTTMKEKRLYEFEY